MCKRIIVQPRGLWLVTGAAAIWGTIGVATQAIYHVESASPLFINLSRMLIATPLLLLLCWRIVGRAMFSIQRRDLAVMLLAGSLIALSHAAYFAAIRNTGVTIATLITISIAPLVVSGLSILLKFEQLTRRTVIALICALAGSVLLVGLQPSEGVQPDPARGVFFSLAAAVFYAGAVIGGRFLASGYHPLQVTSIGFSAGTLVLLAINLASGMAALHTTQGWLLVVYLGIVPTALAYSLFQVGLRYVPATTASIASMMEPLVAALLAWLLFGETLAATGIAGVGLLLLSIILLRQKQPAVETSH